MVLFCAEHPVADVAFEEWYHKVRDAGWENFAQMKATFGSVDSVGNQHYVFNVCGNRYRVVAVVKFRIGFVYIRFIGTHEEYDRISDISNI